MNFTYMSEQEKNRLTPAGELVPRITEETAPYWCLLAEQEGPWETDVAEMNSIDARYLVACYLMDTWPDTWPEDVERYLALAADSRLGHEKASLELAKWKMGRDPDWKTRRDSDVIKLLERALDQGLEEAETARLLGQCYLEGWGTAPDMDQARRCFDRWAEAAGGEAMLQLAVWYKTGRFGVSDQVEGIKWMVKAREAGIQNANERFHAADGKGEV